MSPPSNVHGRPRRLRRPPRLSPRGLRLPRSGAYAGRSRISPERGRVADCKRYAVPSERGGRTHHRAACPSPNPLERPSLDIFPSEAFPPADRVDAQIEWTVARASHRSPNIANTILLTGEGTEFNLTLDAGGRFEVTATLSDPATGEPMGTTRGFAYASWKRPFTVNPPPGPGVRVDVAPFTVAEGALDIYVLTKEPEPLDADSPCAVLRNPSDQDVRICQNGNHLVVDEDGLPVGNWTMRWDTGLVSAGDDAEGTLLVSYGIPTRARY